MGFGEGEKSLFKKGLLPFFLALGQYQSGGKANLIGQIRVQSGVDHAADTIGSKQLTHNVTPHSFIWIGFLVRYFSSWASPFRRGTVTRASTKEMIQMDSPVALT